MAVAGEYMLWVGWFGLSAGVICYLITNYIKNSLKIDDSLDVFSVHGVGGILSTLVYAGVVSYILLKLVDMILGLRVSEDDEVDGLDLSLHDERGYDL